MGRAVFLSAAAFVFCLSACAMQNKMDAGLSKLVGQDIHEATSRLGTPDSQQKTMGDDVYVWTASHEVLVPMAQTNASGALVGGQQISTPTASGYTEERRECKIQITADSNGRIKSYEWSGDGCSLFYGNRLKG